MPLTKSWISTNSPSFSLATNWSDGTSPASGDTLIVDGNGTASITSNLATSLTGMTIYIDASFQGTVGSISGATRNPLVLLGGNVFIGRNPAGNGSGTNFNYVQNSGTNAMTVNVLASSSTGLVTGYAPVIIEGPGVTVNATGGNLALAPVAGTTASGLLNVAAGASTPGVLLGNGASFSTVTISGGTVTSLADTNAATASISNGGTLFVQGSGSLGAVAVGANSTFAHWGAGNVTALTLAGTFNRLGDTRNITISTTTMQNGATFLGDNGKANSITRTSIVLDNCSMQNLTISLPLGERF